MYKLPEFARSFVNQCTNLYFVMNGTLTSRVAYMISKIFLIKPLWNWKDSKFHLHQYLPKQAGPVEDHVCLIINSFCSKIFTRLEEYRNLRKSALVYIISLCYSVAVILYLKSDVKAINILMLTSQTII